MAKITSKVYIHGADYDCSESIRMSYRAIDILPYGSYMWTGNERELLAEFGFIKVNMNHLQRGDVLWKPGHTEMYLGNGVQGGARIDESGGIHGYKKGDQTGREIVSSSFDLSYWQWKEAWRYFGSKTSNGIPAGEAAAQVMEHLINHSAHGYSQDNRAGDGTVEEITLVWDKEKKNLLDVDGWIGVKSITLAQVQMKMPYRDGTISGQDPDLAKYFPRITSLDQWNRQGSMLVAAIQKKVHADVDGIIGPKTILSTCDFVGCKKSKVLDYDVACAIQESLNAGKWVA